MTHAQHFLSHCDFIYTLHNGRITEFGTYQELVTNGGEFARLDKEFGGNSEGAEPGTMSAVSASTIEEVKAKSDRRIGAGTGKLEGRLMRKEARSTGSVSKKGSKPFMSYTLSRRLNSSLVYGSYLKAGRGWLMIPLSILTLVLSQGSQIANSYTLVWWQAKYTIFRSFPLELKLI